MKTNANRLTVALLAVALSVPLAHAQTPAAGPDSPGAPAPISLADARPGGPGKPKHPKHGDRSDDQRPDRTRPDRMRPDRTRPDPKRSGLTSLTTLSGTVGEWTSNDDYILDGFTLSASAGQAGSAPTTVKFPPHLGQQVQKAIKPGSAVSVTGYAENTPQGESRFRLVSLTAGKTTVADAPRTGGSKPRRNQTDDTPALVTATGKIADYQISRNGRVSGLILDNKTIVRVPPHVAGQLSNLATKGQTITVQGYPKEVRDGQVQLQKTQILRASVLTINGQQYLVR